MSKVLISMILAVLLALSLLYIIPVQAQEVPRGPWVDEIVFDSSRPEIGIERLIAGEIDWWHDTVDDPGTFKRIQDAKLPYTVSYGLYYELTFNYRCKMNETTGEIIEPVFPNPSKLPRPEVEGKILMNPFCSRRIREAMHYIVNREFIATQIFGGLAEPRYTAITPNFPDYGRLYDVLMEIEETYKYDLEKGKAIIFEEMPKLGATLVGGKWYYKGAPVTIIFLIRTEDLRKDIGDYVSAQLELLGFTVLRYYGTSRDLAPYWIRADPDDGTFHIYTGGWITTVVDRDQSGNFGFFYTKLGRPETLWKKIINTPEFYEVAERLWNLNFTSLEERRELMTKALWLSMKEENQRIFIVNRVAVWPRRPHVVLASDLAGGYSGAWLWPWTIRIVGQVGGKLKTSMRSILVEPWNPVGGSNWIYDQTIIRATGETATEPDPYSGLYWPHRVKKAEVYVQKGLPVFKSLDWVTLEFVDENKVPDDAWLLFDCNTTKIYTVGEVKVKPELLGAFGVTPEVKTTSLVKVVVYYDENLFRGYKWHDGSLFSLADIVYTFIITFDRACPGSKLYDSAYVPSFQSWLSQFRGFKIVQKDPLIIEYYTDIWYMDAEWSASGAANAFWPYYSQGPGPWHVVEMIARAERDGRLAFTSDKAKLLGVDQANLIGGVSLGIIAGYVDKSIAEKWIPYREVLKDYVTETEAVTRYTNLKNWYTAKGHFWVGNGPFYLEKVDYAARTVTIKAFREHVDRADKYAFLAEPPRPVVKIEAPSEVTIGKEAEITIKVLMPTGEPYKSEYVELVRYIVTHLGGRFTGLAELVEEGVYRVKLTEADTSKLAPGPVSIKMIAVSRIVGIPTTEEIVIVAKPYVPIPTLTPSPTPTPTTPPTTPPPTTPSPTPTPTTPPPAIPPEMIAIIVVVVLVVIALIVFLTRKK
jgi:peptide/nickel transport system substrate-binding protein